MYLPTYFMLYEKLTKQNQNAKSTVLRGIWRMHRTLSTEQKLAKQESVPHSTQNSVPCLKCRARMPEYPRKRLSKVKHNQFISWFVSHLFVVCGGILSVKIVADYLKTLSCSSTAIISLGKYRDGLFMTYIHTNSHHNSMLWKPCHVLVPMCSIIIIVSFGYLCFNCD